MPFMNNEYNNHNNHNIVDCSYAAQIILQNKTQCTTKHHSHILILVDIPNICPLELVTYGCEKAYTHTRARLKEYTDIYYSFSTKFLVLFWTSVHVIVEISSQC